MTALVKSRLSSNERWTYRQFPLAVGYKAFKNGVAVVDLATGLFRPGAAAKGLFVAGKFEEDIDATSVSKLVNINFSIEKEIEWWPNDTVAPVTLAMRGQLCFLLDDQTVTSSTAGASVAGRVWDVDAAKGVAVERVAQIATTSQGVAYGVAIAPAYVSTDSVIPASVQSGSVIDVPTTSAPSTITLPAAPADGTELLFIADGVKNGHTVQYRDVTGTVLLTTALTASKRHQCQCVALNGKWSANAYVSP
ncbi:MAG: hypothetical protein H0X39_00520 [Actinobacteria bacterium]|nr:hypothetical protein [Actinomycetota bacterium]